MKFTLGLTQAELESGPDGSSQQGHILRRVLGKGIATAIKAESLGFNVAIAKLTLNEVDGGATKFNVEFNMVPKETMQYDSLELSALMPMATSSSPTCMLLLCMQETTSPELMLPPLPLRPFKIVKL